MAAPNHCQETWGRPLLVWLVEQQVQGEGHSVSTRALVRIEMVEGSGVAKEADGRARVPVGGLGIDFCGFVGREPQARPATKSGS